MTKTEAIKKWSDGIRSGVMPGYVDGRCLYSFRGHKCAAGILFPDDIGEIPDNVNGCSVAGNAFLGWYPGEVGDLIEGLSASDICKIQRYHDTTAKLGVVGDEFRSLFFQRIREMDCWTDVTEQVWEEALR